MSRDLTSIPLVSYKTENEVNRSVLTAQQILLTFFLLSAYKPKQSQSFFKFHYLTIYKKQN